MLEAFLAFRWVFKGDHAHIENIFWRSIIIYGRPYSIKTKYRVYSTECTVQSVQYTVQSVQYRVYSIQYTVYSIQGASQFVQSLINFLAESPHQDGKACLEGQHVGPPFPTSEHPQVEGDLEGECSRTCRMF